MKVEARITLLADSTNAVKALASITIEDSFVVTGIRVIASQKGSLFCSMPSRKMPNGEYKDICFPLSAEARALITDEILKAYYEKVGEAEATVPDEDFSDLGLPF
jgi:stage V sporulation protein G